jgi:hypothetical protein
MAAEEARSLTQEPVLPLAGAPLLPDGERLRVYGTWALLTSVAFFAVYPTMNWFTSLRVYRLHLYVTPELAIPFVHQFIWAYLSLYALFLLPIFMLPAARLPPLGKQLVTGTLASGVLFALLPAELGFVRTIPADPTYAGIFAAIFGLDRPHNLVPSLHVVWAAAIILACAETAGALGRTLLFNWFAILMASTLLVHQHHVLDIAAAIVLVFILRRFHRGPHA